MPVLLLESTAPGVEPSVDAKFSVPVLALVIVHSDREPERLCEIAFFRPFTTLWLGRGGMPIEDFASFDKCRPGDPEPQPLGLVGCLRAKSFSRFQTKITATAVDLTLENEGTCKMLENRTVVERAVLRPGDTVTFAGEYVLFCVLRSPVMPALKHARRDHDFGGRDAYACVGESPDAWNYRDDCAGVAQQPGDVLVCGETGTGKERTAARIHGLSGRASGPLVKRNAANFPEGLLESELFGKVKDYPTPGPATVGAFPSAKGGTLVLDEAGLISHRAQGALLRALQEGECQTLGESVVRTIDVRVVALTNRDPSTLLPDFRYRFMRHVRISPVRERREDIPLILRDILLLRLKEDASLMRFFMRGADGQLYPRISTRLVDYLLHHELPGNTRNLQAALALSLDNSPGDRLRMMPLDALASRLGRSADGAPVTAPPASLPPSRPISSSKPSSKPSSNPTPSPDTRPNRPISREELVEALIATRWNEARAAANLGISRGRLLRLSEKYEIEKP